MVTELICVSGGLLGLSNFHLRAEAVAHRRSGNTHWIPASRVSNEIVVMRGFCCELKLVKVIQSSAARYMCVFVSMHVCACEEKDRRKGRQCMFTHVKQWLRCMHTCMYEGIKKERKERTRKTCAAIQ